MKKDCKEAVGFLKEALLDFYILGFHQVAPLIEDKGGNGAARHMKGFK